MFQEMVVGSFSDDCSKVTVPETFLSPLRTATWIISMMLFVVLQKGQRAQARILGLNLENLRGKVICSP